MGTWICHLRVAEALLPHLPPQDESAFILGSLGPDSGIPNADWTEFDPPKTVTHFLQQREDEGQIRDLVFYRGYLAPILNQQPSADPARASFVLAYFFHLLCDSLYVRRIWRTSERLLQGEIERRGKLNVINEVKDDWYGLDHLYVRAHPDCAFWRVLMPAPNPPAYLDFISSRALGLQLDYIRQYYAHPEPGLNLERPFPHLNEATMARFVGDCAAACLKIYRRLQTAPPPEDACTALDLLDSADMAAYAPPLGDAAG